MTDASPAGPIAVGILGTGAMAGVMARAIALAPDMTVRAVASGAPGRAEAFAAAHGIPAAHAGRAALLADPGVDLVYIANATERHAEDAIAALGAGKSVLVEKPIAIDPADAVRVAAAAAAAGRFCMEAMWTAFLPTWARLEDIARGGELGAPRHLSFSFGYPADPTSLPRLFDAGAGGGVLLDRGVYGVALALRLLGPATAVQASVTRSAAGADIAAALQIAHEGGAQSQIAVSAEALMGNGAILSCARGTAELEPPVLGGETLALRRASDPAPARDPAAGGGGLKDRLKRSPLLRRINAARSGPERLRLGWGADQHLPMLAHVAACIRARQGESATVPLSASVAALDVLTQARAAGAGA